MFGEFLASLFGRGGTHASDEVEALGDHLAQSPADRDIDTIVPIILPHACLAGDWPGPIMPIGKLPFALAWATVPEQNRFVYLTHGQADNWGTQGIDWRNRALRNLANSTGDRRWWGEKHDQSGKPFVLALLHDDALGPSRLLVPHLFDDLLGADYRVAIPERTCAVAYRLRLTADEQSDVDGMIDRCFREGTEPMSSERFDPAEFWIFGGAREAPKS